MNIDKERELFELLFSTTRLGVTMTKLWNGEYINTSIQSHWNIWKARAEIADNEIKDFNRRINYLKNNSYGNNGGW